MFNMVLTRDLYKIMQGILSKIRDLLRKIRNAMRGSRSRGPRLNGPRVVFGSSFSHGEIKPPYVKTLLGVFILRGETLYIRRKRLSSCFPIYPVRIQKVAKTP